jgi:hypothetical protein
MLEADRDFLDVGKVLFSSHHHPSQSPPGRKIEVAANIVEGKISVSQATATAAAQFLAENTAVKLTPLRTTPTFLDRQGTRNTTAAS